MATATTTTHAHGRHATALLLTAVFMTMASIVIVLGLALIRGTERVSTPSGLGEVLIQSTIDGDDCVPARGRRMVAC